jgi:hypothetical protein
MKTTTLNCAFILLSMIAFACGNNKVVSEKQQREPIYSQGTFSAPLDTALWLVEMDALPQSSVTVENGVLNINTKGGVTVWLKKALSGNFTIEYNRIIVVGDGPNDRLSDMNMFWMANDPLNTNLFTRNGKFEEYDSLAMYYVGVGGNTNTTTRLRRYNGKGDKVLLAEKNREPYLLKPNHLYHIKLVVNNGTTSVWIDGEEWFTFTDPEPFLSGHFGFRSTWSHQQISNLQIWQHTVKEKRHQQKAQ